MYLYPSYIEVYGGQFTEKEYNNTVKMLENMSMTIRKTAYTKHPPLPDKICFIDIKAVFCSQLLKTLNPYSYGSRHGDISSIPKRPLLTGTGNQTSGKGTEATTQDSNKRIENEPRLIFSVILILRFSPWRHILHTKKTTTL